MLTTLKYFLLFFYIFDPTIFSLFYSLPLKIIFFPVLHRNRFISAGKDPVLGHIEKLCIILYFIQFSTNNYKNFYSFGHWGLTKLRWILFKKLGSLVRQK